MESVTFLVLNAASLGSVFQHARRVAEQLASRGWSVNVLSNQSVDWKDCCSVRITTPSGKLWSFLDRCAEGIGARLPAWARILSPQRTISSLRFGVDAARSIREVGSLSGSDLFVVYQHSTFVGFEPKQVEGRVVLVSHGDVFSHPWRSFPIPLRLVYVCGAYLSYRRADLVIAVSEFLASVARRTRASRGAVSVVSNGVAPMKTDLPPVTTRLPDRSSPYVGLRILYVGRLAPEKGVDKLLEALPKVKSGFSSLRVVGSGAELERLKCLSERLKLVDRVHFMGELPHEEVGACYSSADVLVVPSLSEGQGVVALEAMSLGVPVVASNVGGLKEIVRHGANGLLFQPEDPSDLAGCLEMLTDDKALLRRLASSAFATSAAYGWEAVLSQFELELREAMRCPKLHRSRMPGRDPKI